MENASKALIIAGAVLIAIMLISIGMMIITSSSNLTDSVGKQLDQQTITSFNSQFLPYNGTKQRGSTMRGLMQTIVSSNAANPDTQVKVILEEDEMEPQDALGQLGASSYYNVTVDVAGSDAVNPGIVTSITMKKATNTPRPT